MGKKQFQSKSKHAKRGSQPKKKKVQKPNVPRAAPSTQAKQEATAPVSEKPRSPEPASRSQRRATSAAYSYVVSDLIRTIGIAALAFIILVILYLVL